MTRPIYSGHTLRCSLYSIFQFSMNDDKEVFVEEGVEMVFEVCRDARDDEWTWVVYILPECLMPAPVQALWFVLHSPK